MRCRTLICFRLSRSSWKVRDELYAAIKYSVSALFASVWGFSLKVHMLGTVTLTSHTEQWPWEVGTLEGEDSGPLSAREVGGSVWRVEEKGGVCAVGSWLRSDVIREDKSEVIREDKSDVIHENKSDAITENKSNVILEDQSDVIRENKSDVRYSWRQVRRYSWKQIRRYSWEQISRYSWKQISRYSWKQGRRY